MPKMRTYRLRSDVLSEARDGLLVEVDSEVKLHDLQRVPVTVKQAQAHYKPGDTLEVPAHWLKEE